MSEFGVTLTGFRLKRFEDLLLEIEERFRGKFGANVELAADDPLGMIGSIVSDLRASDWLVMQAVYNSFHANLAKGISLDRVGQLNLIVRREAIYSTGFLTFAGTPEVSIPQGTRVRDAAGRQVETLVSAALAPVTGLATVPARAVETGPLTFAPATLTTLVTSLFGVDSVTNVGEVTGGLARESDEEYRLRRAESLQNPGTSTTEGIKNALKDLPYVLDAIVNENVLDTPVGDMPGHSIQAYVLTNLTGSITLYPDSQLEVAQAIWNAKPGGIQTYGDIPTTVTDSNGFTHTVYMTEAAQIPVTVAVTVVPNLDALEGDLFPLNGEQLIKDAILAYGATITMGKDVWLNKIYSAASSVPGVKGITSITLNGVAANLTISPIQLPTFDIDDIGVTLA